MDIHNAQHTEKFSVAEKLSAFQPGLRSKETVSRFRIAFGITMAYLR
jgi:hypothetical protein